MQSTVVRTALYCLLCCGFIQSMQAQDIEENTWPLSRGLYVGPSYVLTDIIRNNYGGLIGLEWNAQRKWWLQMELSFAYGREPYFESPELDRHQYSAQLSFVANYDLLDAFDFYKLRVGGGLGVNALLFQHYEYLEYWNGQLEKADRASDLGFSPFVAMIVENDFRIADRHILFLRANIQLVNYPVKSPEAITLDNGVQRRRIYDIQDAAYFSLGWRHLFD